MSFKIPDTPDELFRSGKNNFNNLNKFFPLVAFMFFILFSISTSFYSVEQDELGVVRRFGKYERTTEPGLHWKIPFNVEQVVKVPVRFVFKEEFGFRTVQAGVQTRYSSANFDDESLMLTGDLNVIDLEWIVQFRITNPENFLFNVRNPQQTVRDLSETVMRLVIGDSTVSEALTSRKNEISLQVQQRLQQTLNDYKTGITIDEVELQDVNPPQMVKASFNEVNEAEQEREKLINQAWSEYNKVIPKARGESERTIREAEGYALARISRAQGESSKFTQTWEAYRQAKDVTKKRLYFETLLKTIPNAGKVYVTEGETPSYLPLLNLNQGQ